MFHIYRFDVDVNRPHLRECEVRLNKLRRSNENNPAFGIKLQDNFLFESGIIDRCIIHVYYRVTEANSYVFVYYTHILKCLIYTGQRKPCFFIINVKLWNMCVFTKCSLQQTFDM